MKHLGALFVSIVFILSGSSFAVDPPTAQKIRENGINFARLVELQQERERLLPAYLDRRPQSLVGHTKSILGEAKNYWERLIERHVMGGAQSKDEALDIMEALFDKVHQEENSGLLKKLLRGNSEPRQTEEAYQQRKQIIKGLRLALAEMDNYMKDTEENLVVPDLKRFREYNDMAQAEKLHEFLKTWISSLTIASENLETIFYNINFLKERFNELNDNKSDPTVNKTIEHVADFHAKILNYLAETQKYAEFEQKCDAFREFFVNGRNVADAVILEEIALEIPFQTWLEDMEKHGPAFFSIDHSATVSAPFLRWSLERFNKLTVGLAKDHAINARALAQIDSAYRIFFIRLQIEDAHAEDFPYLVQQRQLARNGITLSQAYASLLHSLGCSLTTTCSTPSFSGLFKALNRLTTWINENPLEAQIIIEEVNHAYSILAGSNGTLLGDVTGAFNNILQRRGASDFLREVLYGTYVPIVDPAKAMPPEIIALTNLAPVFPYLAAIGKGLTGGGLFTRITTFSLSFASAGIPTVVVLCANSIASVIQVKVEKEIARRIPNSAEANAAMAGILKWAKTGDIREALRKASVIYFARRGAQWFGNSCMQGGWVHAACDATLAMMGPVYGWFAGDFTTGAAMLAGYVCVKYTESKTAAKNQESACTRANRMIAQIARNIDADGEKIAAEARRASQNEKEAETDYQGLLKLLSHGKDTKAASTIFDTIFGESVYGYPAGVNLLQFMADKGV